MAITVSKYGNPLRVMTPTYTQDMEGVFLSGWTNYGIPANGDITQDGTWHPEGTYSAKTVITTEGNPVYSYTDVLSLTSQAWCTSFKCRLDSAAGTDGYAARFIWTGQNASPYYYAIPGVYESGGAYYWQIEMVSPGLTQLQTTYALTADTDYFVEIGRDEVPKIWMKVDGIMVGAVAGGAITTNIMGLGSPVSTAVAASTVFVDDIQYHDKYMRFSYGLLADDGSYVIACTYKATHASTDGVVKVFRSTDAMVSWTLAATISYVGKNLQAYSVQKATNGDLFLSVNADTYADGHVYHSFIWKSTDDGANWTEMCEVGEGSVFFPSMLIQSGTELACMLWQVDANWYTGGVKMMWYDTADDTYTVGTTLKTNPDGNVVYNESMLVEKDNGNYLAFLRVDDYTGADQLYLVVMESSDQGVTWGSATSLDAAWGMIGGTPSFAKFFGRYFVSGYRRFGSGSQLHQHVIFEFDPDDFSKIGSDAYPLTGEGDGDVWTQEGGNGTMRRVPGTSTVTLAADYGMSGMYLLDVGGLVPQLDQPVLTADIEQVSAAFTSHPDADSVNLYWSTTNPVTTADNKVTGATSPHVITGLTGGVPVYVAVAAMFAGDEGSLSVQASATPLSPTAPGDPLPPPQRDKYNPNSLELRVLRTIGENL